MYYLLDIISKGTVVALVLSDFEDGGSSVVLTLDVDMTGGVQPELVRLENNNTLVIPLGLGLGNWKFGNGEIGNLVKRKRGNTDNR